MELKQENTDIKGLPLEPNLIRLAGNDLIVKKRDIPKSERPRMYLKVRELLSGVNTDMAKEIIAAR
jgi:hypothetical protein